jgi:hypothetical protein
MSTYSLERSMLESSLVDTLPNLPGFRIKDPISTTKKTSFNLINGEIFEMLDQSQHMERSKSGPTLPEDRSVLNIGSTLSLTKSQSKGILSKSLQNAGVTLTFQAYFTEIVPTTGAEVKRYRKCILYYYVENFTMMIIEKPTLNSGIPQGKILKKAIVTKEDGTPYLPEDLYIGAIVNVNKRLIHLVDCDSSTKDYLAKHYDIDNSGGVIAVPLDPYIAQRKRVEKSLDETWGAYHSMKNPNKTFLEVMKGTYVDNSGREGYMRYGNKTLKFKCVWNNTENLYGDRLEFCLTYYLSDDTVEILSTSSLPGIKAAGSKLVKRTKLPKQLTAITLEPTEVEQTFYHWVDLAIGTDVRVYSRVLRIVDSDSKTRSFYESQGCPLEPPEAEPELAVIHYEREIPPHIGIGSEEDTLRSCNGPLMPGPIKAVKQGENKSLSFFASLLSGGIDDVERRFVITHYVQNDTLKITEPPMRNSGFNGGCFLSRRAIKTEDGQSLTAKNYWIGGKLQILKHRFLLLDANESTIRWMEDQKFPRCSFYDILNKMRQVIFDDARNGNFAMAFEAIQTSPGICNADGFRKVLLKYGLIGDLPMDLSDHEQLTILRAMNNYNPSASQFNYNKLIEEIINPTDEYK